LAFLFEEINLLKKQLTTKIPNSKKRKTELLLSTEVILTTTSDEDEEFLPFFSSLTRMKSNKLAKTSHPTSELVVSLNINNEEQLLRALAVSFLKVILQRILSKGIKVTKPHGAPWVASSSLTKLV
jgi:CRISPR/Cas system CMR subunit Cmr6 (Cas7 group RAMP superfamily)